MEPPAALLRYQRVHRQHAGGVLQQQTRLALTGFLSTSVTYGPARMGFGLFLPQFRESFALSSETAGLIASGAFFAFVLTVVLAGAMTARTGPRAPVVLAAMLAVAGMALVAGAQSTGMLAAGVVLAGSSAGLSWSPFNNASNRLVPAPARPGVLSTVSTGTTVGVALAGALALAAAFTGVGWRAVWALFAGVGVAAGLVAASALRPLAGGDGFGAQGRDIRALLSRDMLPLCLAAGAFGMTAAIYISFAADWVVRSGKMAVLPPDAVGPVLFMAYGLFGLTGLFTGALERRLGLVLLLRVIFLCAAVSLALVALVPGILAAVIVSAGLQGICVMTISAVLSFWSARLFPAMPAWSFTAALLAVATGSVVGPAAAGIVMTRVGTPESFLAAAALALISAAVLRSRRIRTAPADPA